MRPGRSRGQAGDSTRARSSRAATAPRGLPRGTWGWYRCACSGPSQCSFKSDHWPCNPHACAANYKDGFSTASLGGRRNTCFYGSLNVTLVSLNRRRFTMRKFVYQVLLSAVSPFFGARISIVICQAAHLPFPPALSVDALPQWAVFAAVVYTLTSIC